MRLRTRVFDLMEQQGYSGVAALAVAMGMSHSFLSLVKSGKRQITRRFIDAALRAFPGYGFNDLFYYTAASTPEPLEAAV